MDVAPQSSPRNDFKAAIKDPSNSVQRPSLGAGPPRSRSLRRRATCGERTQAAKIIDVFDTAGLPLVVIAGLHAAGCRLWRPNNRPIKVVGGVLTLAQPVHRLVTLFAPNFVIGAPNFGEIA